MKIVVIGAMSIETEELCLSLTNAKNSKVGAFEVTVGTYCDSKLTVCRCGIGKVHSAAAVSAILTADSDIDAVINIGVAGGIGGGVRQGDIVIGEKCVQHDYDSTPDGMRLGQIPGFDSEYFYGDSLILARMKAALQKSKKPYHVGVIASGDQFISSKSKADSIAQAFGAIACDMESCSIAQVCALFKVPFLAMRAISDNGGDSAVKSFYEFLTEAAKNSTAAILEFIKSET